MNNKKLKFLLAEDSDDDAHLILNALSQYGWELEYVRVMAETPFCDALNQGDWDIILCDYCMPGFIALDALTIVQQDGRDIPFIIVSGTIGEDVAVEALKHGASDYILKDNLARLATAVDHEIRDAEDRKQKRLLEAFSESQTKVLEMILNGDPLNSILECVATRIEKLANHQIFCSIYLSNTKSTELILSTAPSLPQEYIDATRTIPIEKGIGSCGTAAALQQTVIIDDIVSHPDWQPVHDLLIKHQLCSCWSVPVLSSDHKILGTLGIYHKVCRNPSRNEIRWVESSARVISVAIEHIRAAEKLRKSETQFRELAENIDEVFYNRQIDNEQILYVSPAYEKIWGRSCESLRENTFSYMEAIHPDDRNLAIEAVEKQNNGENTDIEYRVIRPDGEVRWMRDRSYPLQNKTSGERRVVGVARDITERKKALLALGRSNRALKMLSACNEALARATDENQLLEHICRLAVEIGEYRMAWVGYAMDDEKCSIRPMASAGYDNGYVARLELSWSADSKNGQDPAGRAIRSGLPEFCEDIAANPAFLLSHEAALQRNYRSVFFLPLSDGMRNFGVIGLYSSEQHYLIEDEINLLQKLAENLAFGINHKKLERQFFRIQRMESIGTLAGGIAHDLNNILAPISMSTDLLKLSMPDKRSLDLIAAISSNAKRAADMVGQVLSFARGVEGNRVEVQLRHVMEDIEKIARDTFPKNIQFHNLCNRNLWTVIGDPTQLHQVLLNLCVNARDAMPNGGRLTVSADNVSIDEQYTAMNIEAKTGPHIIIRVEDSGEGIPKSIIEKIFDPFFTTKAAGKGTGLGLSTSLAIIKSHGGFIRTYSEPGSGTSFKVFLPAKDTSTPEQPEQEQKSQYHGNGQGVLVVDDEASIRDILQQALSAYGYNVFLAADGAQAITTYVQNRAHINVVIIDMTMPVMDGNSTIKVLTRMNPDLRIIAASGISRNQSRANAASPAVKHFLAKPFTTETLLKALAEVLKA